ncbi:hypothetical protein RD792_011672 [Penstemon davidsonii]|uniref:Pentatricopeptide repeat-containing protein n=1 Tax=Penstemon davidsonii TaxID=160366 RepID=A0ABR0CWA9_9LAMI|nr:hypothetical protein RD792_011672 [Penstemon davidsonii]
MWFTAVLIHIGGLPSSDLARWNDKNFAQNLSTYARRFYSIRKRDLFYVPSLIACTTLIEGLHGVGRTEESVNLTRKMLDHGIIPDSVPFSCVIQDMCNVGRALEANKLRYLALKKGLGLGPDGMMYRILISSLFFVLKIGNKLVPIWVYNDVDEPLNQVFTLC